jgi:hypothetical protein
MSTWRITLASLANSHGDSGEAVGERATGQAREYLADHRVVRGSDVLERHARGIGWRVALADAQGAKSTAPAFSTRSSQPPET